MSRYFFHVRHGDTYYEDRKGAELPGLAEALACAERDARTPMEDDPSMAPDDWWVEIADDNGDIRRTVPFEIVAAKS